MANNNNSNMSTSNFISSIGRGVQRHAYKIQLNKAYKNKPEEANKILANYNKKVAENVKWRRNNPLLAYMKNQSGSINYNNNTMAAAPAAAQAAAPAAAQAAAPAAAVAAPVAAAASSGWFSGPGWSLDPRQWNRYRPSIEAAEKERKERGTSGSSNNRKSWTNMSQNEQNAKVASWGNATSENAQKEIANAQAEAAAAEEANPYNSNKDGGRRRRSRKATRKGRKATRKGRKAMRKNRTSRR
jgi:hypothetical protein